MDDFRFLDNNNIWIWVILAFLLFSNCGGSNFSLNGLFGCNSTLMWVVVAFVAYYLLSNNGCGGGIFRNEIQ